MKRRNLREIAIIEAKLCAKLKKTRQAFGFSQSKVADHLGISYQQYQKYECGENRLSAGYYLYLCKLYGNHIYSEK